MVQLTQEQENEAVDFIRSMGNNLKESTIKLYLTYYNKIQQYIKKQTFDQKLVNEFLNKHRSSGPRAFIKNYIAFKKYPLEIPKRTGSIPKKEPAIIPQQRMNKIIEYLYQHSPNKGFGIAAEISASCALRLAEFVNLKKEDLRINQWIEETEKNPTQKIPCELIIHGKGVRDRIILLPFKLFCKIIDFAEEKKDYEKIFSFAEHRFWDKFNEACKKLGYISINKGKEKALYHPHSMRHTKATKWLEEGENLVHIQYLLGHSSLSTTQIYLNPDKKLALKQQKERMIREG